MQLISGVSTAAGIQDGIVLNLNISYKNHFLKKKKKGNTPVCGHDFKEEIKR